MQETIGNQMVAGYEHYSIISADLRERDRAVYRVAISQTQSAEDTRPVEAVSDV